MGKRIDYSFISGTSGMPFKKGTWKHLQEAYWEGMQEFVAQGAGGEPSDGVGYAVWGNLNRGDATNYDIAPGAIWYNGKMYSSSTGFFTATGVQTAVAQIVTSYYTDTTADPTTFTDGAIHNVHVIETIEWVAGAVGSGIFNFNDLVRVLNVEDAVEVGGTGAPAFTSPSNVGNDPGGTYATLKFQRDNRNKTVMITGTIKVVAYPDTTNTTVFTLPVGYRPILEQAFTTYLFGSPPLIVSGTVKTNGDVVLGHDGFTYSNVYLPFQVIFNI